jgi:hypothetical protein
MENYPTNFGVLQHKDYDPRDWKAGGVTGIPDEGPIKLDGQWDEDVPAVEIQRGPYFDSNYCTAYACLNAGVEIYLKGKYGIEENYSDRALGTMSGNQRNGNYIKNPPKTLMEKGCPLEHEWPWDKEAIKTWEEYNAPVPEAIQASGLAFKNKYTFFYEWVYGIEQMMEQLKYSPLTGHVYAWPRPDENGIYPRVEPSERYPQHLVTIYGYVQGEYIKIFDHYSNSHKKLAWDYFIPNMMRFFISKKDDMPEQTYSRPNNTLIMDSESGRSGAVALYLEGKKYLDDLAKINSQFMFRNNGDIKGKTTGVTAEEWDYYPTYNLKNERINL